MRILKRWREATLPTFISMISCDVKPDGDLENGMSLLILIVCFVGSFFERECAPKTTMGAWLLGNLKEQRKWR